MKPRQLIIVHGPPEASQDLAECCRGFGGKDIKVYMPKLHETVDATSETHIYQVSTLAFEPRRSKYFLLQIRTDRLGIQWWAKQMWSLVLADFIVCGACTKEIAFIILLYLW